MKKQHPKPDDVRETLNGDPAVDCETEKSNSETDCEQPTADAQTSDAPVEEQNSDDNADVTCEANSPSDASQPPHVPTAKEIKKKKIIKIVSTIIIVAVIIAVIVYTAYNDFHGEDVDFSRIFSLIGSRWYYLFVLLGLFFATILLETLKLFFMIRKTTHTYKLGTAFNCAVLGKFYDYVTPLGSGGQPFQIYYLSKHGVPGGPAGAIPIGSMFLSQFTFVLCAIVAFCVGVPSDIVPPAVQILAYFGAVFYIAIPAFLVIFSFFPKAGNKLIDWGVNILAKIRLCKNPDRWKKKGHTALENNKKNMKILFKSKRVLIVGSFFALLYNIAQCSLPYFALLLFPDALSAYGWTPSWGLWFQVTCITFFVYCATTFIPTPGNSGAMDGTFYGLFRGVLVTVAGASFTCMMIWRIYSFYMYLLLGVIVSIGVKVAGNIRARKKLLQ